MVDIWKEVSSLDIWDLYIHYVHMALEVTVSLVNSQMGLLHDGENSDA